MRAKASHISSKGLQGPQRELILEDIMIQNKTCGMAVLFEHLVLEVKISLGILKVHM